MKQTCERPPRVLAILPGIIPSTYITVAKPFLELHRQGFINARISLEAFANLGNLPQVDLVVFCRNTEPKYADTLDAILKRRIPYIYDLDDNFFAIPGNSNIAKYHRDPTRLALLTRYIRHANHVRVYSEELLRKVQTLNPQTERVLGPVDQRLLPRERRPSNHGKIKLVYATNRHRDDFVSICLNPLTRVLNEYPERVELHLWGCDLPKLRRYEGVRYHPPISDYDHFFRSFARSAYDIALAPLTDDIFSRSKSDNKFREYGDCGLAGIYSRVRVYTDCVENDVTGILVSNDPEEWYNAIVRLIEDHSLREAIQMNARKYVLTHYSLGKFERVWYEQIRNVLERSRKGEPCEPGSETLKEKNDEASTLHGLNLVVKLFLLLSNLRRRNISEQVSAVLCYVRIRIRLWCSGPHP